MPKQQAGGTVSVPAPPPIPPVPAALPQAAVPQAQVPPPPAPVPVPQPAVPQFDPSQYQAQAVPIPTEQAVVQAPPAMPPPMTAPPASAMPTIPTMPPLPGGNGAPVAPAMPDMSTQMAQMMGQSGGLLESLDLSSVSEISYRLIPTEENGQKVNYESVITKVEQTTSKTGGAMLTVDFRTVWPRQHSGVGLRDYFTFDENSLWKIKSLGRACDLLTEDGSRFKPGTSYKDFVDYVVRHNVRHDPFMNQQTGLQETRNKIDGGYSEAYEAPGLQTVGSVPTAATPPQVVQQQAVAPQMATPGVPAPMAPPPGVQPNWGAPPPPPPAG